MPLVPLPDDASLDDTANRLQPLPDHIALDQPNGAPATIDDSVRASAQRPSAVDMVTKLLGDPRAPYKPGFADAFTAQYVPGGKYAMAGDKYLADRITHPIDTAQDIYGALTGSDTPERRPSFNDEFKDVNNGLTAYSEDHPIMSAAASTLGMLTDPVFNKLTSTVSGLIPEAAKTAPALVKTAIKYARFGSGGGAAGAVDGLLNAQDKDGGLPTIGDAVNNTLHQGELGAASSMILPPALGSIAWGGRKIGGALQTVMDKMPFNQESAVARALAKTVGADSITPDILQANRALLGPNSNVVDTAGTQDPNSGVWLGGRNTYRAADALANSPGSTQDLAERVLKPRPGQAGTDIIQSVQKHLAPGDFHDTFDTLSGQQSDNASPLYDQAFSANKSMQSPMIDRILKTPAGQDAMAYARERMQNRMARMGVPDPELTDQLNDLVSIGQQDPVKGGVASGLKLQTLDLIKQGLQANASAVAKRAAMGNAKMGEAADIGSLAKSLTSELDRLDTTAQAGPNSTKAAGGAYAQARAAYAGPARLQDALENGRDFMSGDREIAAKDFAALSPSEKDMFRLGAARSIQGDVEQNGTVPARLKNILNPASKQRALMNQIFPNFDSFLNDVGGVVRKGQAVRMIGGSDTAARLNNVPDIGNDLAGAAVDLGMGNHMGAAKGVLGGIKNWLTQPSAGAQAELGRLLLDPSAHDEAVNLLRQRAVRPASNLLNPATLNAGRNRYAANSMRGLNLLRTTP